MLPKLQVPEACTNAETVAVVPSTSSTMTSILHEPLHVHGEFVDPVLGTVNVAVSVQSHVTSSASVLIFSPPDPCPPTPPDDSLP